MQKKDLDFFKKWFLDYVNQFSSSDIFIQDNIKKKIEHTERVCENISLLNQSMKIQIEGDMLAETMALFHDIGRFEQFVRYKTFKDSESENHALLGVKILKNTGILSSLLPKEKNLILKTVEYHNLMEIPKYPKSSIELLFYSKLIRDADKLDILRIMSEIYTNGGESHYSAFDLYLPNTSGCSESIIMDILHNRMAKNRDVRNVNDIKLLRLSWIFDINFPTTIALLKENKYLNKIMSSMSATEEVYTIKKHIENYLDSTKNDTKIELNEI